MTAAFIACAVIQAGVIAYLAHRYREERERADNWRQAAQSADKNWKSCESDSAADRERAIKLATDTERRYEAVISGLKGALSEIHQRLGRSHDPVVIALVREQANRALTTPVDFHPSARRLPPATPADGQVTPVERPRPRK